LPLEEKTEFECVQPKKGCFIIEKNGELIPCPQSPCPLNLEKFGTHERIIENYLEKEDYAGVHYYYKDLLSMSSFNCDLELLEDLRKEKSVLEASDYPAACRVFYFSREMKSLRRDIKYYEKLPYEELSEEGKENYDHLRNNFREILDSALEVLSHLVIDKVQERKDNLLEMRYRINVVSAQTGELKLNNLQMPVQKDVKDTIEGKDMDKKDKKQKKKEKISGF
jgi:hypothetical protein